MKNVLIFTILFLSFIANSTEKNVSKKAGKTVELTPDYRLLVEMPEDSRLLLRKEMLKNLQTLNIALTYIDNGDFEAAAELTESSMGKSSMGKYKGMSNRPGKYFPEAFHDMGHAMHGAASDFSVATKTGDPKKIIHSLSVLTSYCSGCHSGMRVE